MNEALPKLDRARMHELIRYPQFQQRHWQIGSGSTEAECKTTTRRVKGHGRRWNAANAEAMIALAALHDSGLWNQCRGNSQSPNELASPSIPARHAAADSGPILLAPGWFYCNAHGGSFFHPRLRGSSGERERMVR